jgi:dihydrofolate synthase/folylpolyglutamate synthase
MKDKDIVGVVGNIRDVVTRWYLPPLKVARAATPASLAGTLRSLGVEGVEWDFREVSGAVSSARANARADDLIVVFGSFFLVAEYLAQCPDLPR